MTSSLFTPEVLPETLVSRKQIKMGLITEKYWIPLKAEEQDK